MYIPKIIFPLTLSPNDIFFSKVHWKSYFPTYPTPNFHFFFFLTDHIFPLNIQKLQFFLTKKYRLFIPIINKPLDNSGNYTVKNICRRRKQISTYCESFNRFGLHVKVPHLHRQIVSEHKLLKNNYLHKSNFVWVSVADPDMDSRGKKSAKTMGITYKNLPKQQKCKNWSNIYDRKKNKHIIKK